MDRNQIPSVPETAMPPWQVLKLAEGVSLPSGQNIVGQIELFQLIYQITAGAVFASMIAYFAAQYTDVRLFHFLEKISLRVSTCG